MGDSKRRKRIDPQYGKVRQPYRDEPLEIPSNYQNSPLPCFGYTAFQLVGDRPFSVTFFSVTTIDAGSWNRDRQTITFLPIALSVEPALGRLATKPHLITIVSVDPKCSINKLLSVKLNLFAAKSLEYRDSSGLPVIPCALESERLLLDMQSSER